MSVMGVRSVASNNISQADTEGGGGKLSVLTIALLLVIIACVNHMFRLVPWAQIHGTFNTRDVGLLLLGVMFLGVLRHRVQVIFENGFSVLVILYLFFVIVQASVVSFNYGQSVVDGVIAIRHQFYYLSFFVFLALLDDKEKIAQLFRWLWYLALVLCVIGFINHFVLTLYHHAWAEGHNVRAGIMRAFFAGMSIITMALFWSIANLIVSGKIKAGREAGTLLIISAHVLRQTRGIIVGVAAGLLFVLLLKRRFKTMIVAFVVAAISVLVAEVTMDENIFTTPFVSTYEDVIEGTGSWAGRMKQIETAMRVFLENPYFGSGAAALRVADGSVSLGRMSELSAIARQEDLGYVHWLKAYGIPGIFWLLTLFYLIYKYLKKIRNCSRREHEIIAVMVTGYIGYFLVSFITLPHLMRPDLIVLICLILATLVKVARFNEADNELSRRGESKA